MLEQLFIADLALAVKTDIAFPSGMNCITGETGAGKSLIVDALELVLGGRADARIVRDGSPRCEVSATFSLSPDDRVQRRLQSLEMAGEDGSVIIRRVVSNEGKSRAWINGHPCTLALVREIGAMLVSLYGQHAGMRLMDEGSQLEMLDSFGGLRSLRAKVEEAYAAYSRSRNRLTELSQRQKEGAAAYKRMRYEVGELKALSLQEGDYERLEQSFDRAAHAAQLNDAVALARACLDNDEHNVIDVLLARRNDLIKVKVYDEKRIDKVLRSLDAALTALDDAREDLMVLDETMDSASLQSEIESKMSRCHELARRFEVEPKRLFMVLPGLQQQLDDFLALHGEIESLTAEVKAKRDHYERLAADLSAARKQAALKMEQEVTERIRILEMPDGIFKVQLDFDAQSRPLAHGRDHIKFLFSANQGQSPRELNLVASGGELSRLALAIEVLTSKLSLTPTLIFDEVDTGISGRTASAVGRLLHELGSRLQVLTVTHLPQVAAFADAQFLVVKHTKDGAVSSQIKLLDREGRIEELARMMGGSVVTAATRESAAQLLDDCVAQK